MSNITPIWQDIVVSPETTITDAINVLNQTGKMFLMVVDDNQQLIGNLTDGDLRKGLLKFNDLSIPIAKIMNTSPKTISVDTTTMEIMSIFKNDDIKALPVIDQNNILHGCYFETDFSKTFLEPDELIIMAGGFGKRMGELTKDLPKPMLDVDGKPILEHIIENAKQQGFNRFYISVHYQAEKIISYFKDGQAFGVKIEYIHESEPLGTGGSIKLLPEGTGPVVVTNADIISAVNFRALIDYHILTKATATMVTHEHHIQNPFGVIHADGIRISKLEEKPVWKTNVNAGIYAINRDVCGYIKPNEKVDMPEIVQRLLEDDNIVVQYPIYEKLFEIGTLEKYKNFTNKPHKL